MSIPVTSETATTFTLAWKPEGIAAELANVREQQGNIRAEVTFFAQLDNEKVVPLLMRRISLVDDGDRWRICKALTDKMDQVNWSNVLEQTCMLSVRWFRKGEPVVSLVDVEAPNTLAYLVDRIIPEDATTIVFGDGGTGKSMFALYTAVAVAAGVSLPHNLRPARTGNVLYLDWEETDPGEHRRRLRRIAQGLGVPEPRGIYYRPCFRPLVEDVELLEVEVRRLDISLVIADSLMPACGGDPADSMAAIQTMNALRRLGATRLAIGHITQAARQGPAPLQTTFGSVVWRNLARAQWQLVSDDDQPDDSSNRFALYQRKTNNDRRDRWPIGLRYDFVEDGGPITMHADDVHATDGLAVGASITERIRRALAEGGLKGTEELGELVDRTPDQVRGILTKMRDVVNINAGQTGKGHKGLYGLKAHGESPAQQFRCFKCGDPWAELYDDQEGRPCCARHQSASA